MQTLDKEILEKMSAADRVHTLLRNRILDGGIEQGQRLVVRELAMEYETSDQPVREAIRMLVGDGLAVVNKNRGACVISLSYEDIPGAYLLRGEIESLAIRLSGPRFTQADIDELSRMADEMEMLAIREEVDDYSAVNRDFHALLIARCPYPNILREVDSLWNSRFNFAFIFGIDARQVMRSSTHHLRVVEALKVGNWELAGALSRARKLEIARFLMIALNKPVPPELFDDEDGMENTDA